MAGGDIELTFDLWHPDPLPREPFTVGVPFPPGALRSAGEACLFDGDAELYCQRKVLTAWPDGSVRWLLLDFQVDLPAGAGKALRLVYGRGASAAALEETGISLGEERSELVVDNGLLRFVCHTRPLRLLDTVQLDGREVLSAKEPLDFRVMDLSGNVYRAGQCKVPSVTVEAGGPLRTTVRFEGSHLDEAGRAFLDFALLLTTWSGKPYVSLEYQIIHRGGEGPAELQEASCGLTFAGREQARFAAGAGEALRPGDGIQVTCGAEGAAIDIPRAPFGPRQPCPESAVASPWLERAGAGRCLGVAVRHALQQFPKRLAAEPGSLGVAFYPRDEVPLRLHQGAAKSHEMLLYFHAGEPEGEAAAVARRALRFNLAERPRLPAAWVQEARAFGSQFPARPLFHLDAALDQAFDNRPRGMGLLHFGDEPHPLAPAGARGAEAVVWSHNAYDLAHALLLHYVRSGQHRHFAAAEALVRHVMDVDHVHFSPDPLRDGGLAPPCVVGHGRGDAPASAGHQWVEGLLAYHYLTGSERAALTVRRVGENVLRQVPALVEQAGEAAGIEAVAWALYTAATLYRELGRPQYFEAARKLIDRLADALPSPTGPPLSSSPRGAGATPATVAVALTAVQRYHLVSKERRAADLLLRQLDGLLAGGECLWRHTLFPGLRPDLCSAALLLEPLAFAYQLTSEARYLEAGRPLVRHLVGRGGLSASAASVPEQQLVGDAIVCRPVVAPLSGLELAQVVRPLLAYLAAAEAAGQLEGLGL